MVELWKLNNLFKLFLLSFVAVFLLLIFALNDIQVSQYLLIVLVMGAIVYLVIGFRFVPKAHGRPTKLQRLQLPTRVHILATILIFSLFASSYIIARTLTTPSPFQIVKFQYLILPDGQVLSMSALQPNNECAWLESMNVTTQQRARQLGLPDCDYVAWYHRTSPPTLFLEFQNFTELTYNLSNTTARSTGSELLCFSLSLQSFQCWVPPASVSHLK